MFEQNVSNRVSGIILQVEVRMGIDEGESISSEMFFVSNKIYLLRYYARGTYVYKSELQQKKKRKKNVSYNNDIK